VRGGNPSLEKDEPGIDPVFDANQAVPGAGVYALKEEQP
jgi:hypothetical protein